MSQNQRPNQRLKEKLEPKSESMIIINQPMVRNFSTGGGHGPEDTLVEGDSKIVTKKWQGYPPKDLNIVGKPHPPMPEVAIPRFTGKAQYATRILLPNMLFAKLVTSPHPRATVKSMDVSVAEKMPGVRYILTPEKAPKTYPLPQELFFQGEVVAIVAAETEDQAEDAIEAIDVEYNVLPFASTLAQVMAPNAPQLRNRPNMSTSLNQWGDVDKAFAEADIVKEFTYVYGSGIPIPMQPTGCVAKWDGDRVTIWGMSQGIYPQRDGAAMRLGIPPEKVHYINKWNGGTFGGARRANEKFYPWIAHISKEVNRPVKLTLGKDQELAHCEVKPQNIQKFKVGAMKDGRIIACQREFHVNVGANHGAGGSAGRSAVDLHGITKLKTLGFS